jgi:prolyl-tRNA synthetase
MSTCQRLQEKLVAASIAVKLDDDETHTPGWKFNYWELKGVPLRIEIGPRDVQRQQLIFVRRDTGKKTAVKDGAAVFEAKELLRDIQNTLKTKAEKFLNDHIYEATDQNELKKILNDQGGLVKIQWCGLVKCADILKNETNGGVIRGTLYGKNEIASMNCVICGKKATQIVYVSKQY